MWQPLGVVAASGVAYGTAAKYRCAVTLPSCINVASGEACCTVASNMGWRYLVIVLGAVTLLIFFLRYFVFKFHESPKFLLSKGREQEAIDVLHRIAKFNRCAPPTLTVEHFAEVDAMYPLLAEEPHNKATVKHVITSFFAKLKHLKGIFGNKLQACIFCLLAVAYMVDKISQYSSGTYADQTLGRLLVFQLDRLLPTYHPPSQQRLGRQDFCTRDLQTIRLHQTSWYLRCRLGFVFSRASSDRTKMVLGLLRCLPRAGNGNVHSSKYDRRICWAKRIRICYANCKLFKRQRWC